MKGNFTMVDYIELGNEYANLVCASEFGVNKFGTPMQSDSKREKEIEDIFSQVDYSLQDYVECAFEILEEDGFIKWTGKNWVKA
jgi:hypothetical protein